VVELGLLAPRSLDVALRHAVVLREEVDEYSEEGQDDHEDDPERLRSAADVVSPENVGEDGDQKPEPDHPGEEDEHRPEDVEKWVARCEQRRTSCSVGSTVYRTPRRLCAIPRLHPGESECAMRGYPVSTAATARVTAIDWRAVGV